jgi:hypothetical protein
VTPGWAPGAAHLTGKAPSAKPGEEAKAGETKLDDLAKEVEEKRKS